MRYLTADPHYYHVNRKGTGIIDYCSRPFDDIDQMNQRLVDNHNETVDKSTSDVYIIGDLGFNLGGILDNILPQLKGNIHLILGNHDAKLKRYKKYIKETGGKYLKSVQWYKEIKVEKKKVVLFHFPLLSWNAHYYGAIHLFGHCHGTMLDIPGNIMDVGVDARAAMYGRKPENYRPFSWDEIQAVLKDKPPLTTPFSRWQKYLELNFNEEGLDDV